MPTRSTDSFRRWADGFDRRHRFGIPVITPTAPNGRQKGGNMPPSIVPLPARAGSMKFSDDDVKAVIELLGQCTPGQAVKLTDEPDDKENTSRRRAEIMKDQIEQVHPESIRSGFKVRGHVLTAGEPEVRKVSGKNYKFYPQNWGAVSLVPDNDPGTPTEPPPTPDAPDTDTVPDNDPGTPTEPPPAPDTPDATDGSTTDLTSMGNIIDSGAADGTDGNNTTGARRGRKS